MPEYDFVCRKCKKFFTRYFSFEAYGQEAVICPNCGDQNVQRRIKRVRFSRSSESRIENFSDFSDEASLAELEKDPRALGGMMRKMRNEIGEEMGPEFNEVVDRLEKGQSPEDIERELPDLGGGDDDGMA